MIVLLVLSFGVAFLASLWLLLRARRHARRYAPDLPQRFHSGDVPRVGGVGVLAGMLIGWLFVLLAPALDVGLNVRFDPLRVGLAVLALLPAIAGGVYEDLTQRLAVRYRLGLTLLSAALACGLLGLSVPRLGLPGVDALLQAMPWLGVGLALLAVAGLPHAFNIIDGYNGLAATVALLVGLAIAYVALQLGDRQLAAMVLCLVGATAGFLVWNYPRGLIFAGDGGAYLWGLVIALACIVLVQRHPLVSPWFPMLLLIYPVTETLFSIYRKLARGTSPGVADALHFHQLIYRRLVRGVFHDVESRRVLMRNNRTSPYLWGFTLLSVLPAVLFWRNTPVLMLGCGLFVVAYVLAYLMLVRFKVPRWLRR